MCVFLSPDSHKNIPIQSASESICFTHFSICHLRSFSSSSSSNCLSETVSVPSLGNSLLGGISFQNLPPALAIPVKTEQDQLLQWRREPTWKFGAYSYWKKKIESVTLFLFVLPRSFQIHVKGHYPVFWILWSLISEKTIVVKVILHKFPSHRYLMYFKKFWHLSFDEFWCFLRASGKSLHKNFGLEDKVFW